MCNPFEFDLKLRKIGEHPSYGPPTPAKVTSLIGSEKDYYHKGLRAESQDLGIAAFAYYRRVIENRKNKIYDEIIKVAKKLDSDPAIITDLEQAKLEIQFTKSVAIVKHGIPEALLINGMNPLTLLHSALSEGIHNHSDKECLKLAASIRAVLFGLIERMQYVLKEHNEIDDAVKVLIQKQSEKKSRINSSSDIEPTDQNS